MKLSQLGLVVCSAFLAPVFVGAAEEAQEVTLTGEPVDMECFLLGRSGEAHASCARSCAEKGTPIGFLAVDDEGNEALYLVLGAERKPAKEYMAEHMGKEVEATGKVTTKSGMKILTVSKVEAGEDDDWLLTDGLGSASIVNE